MSDNDLRYTLYKIMGTYGYGTSLLVRCKNDNFWLEFCKQNSLNLTKQKLDNFKEKIYVVLQTMFDANKLNIADGTADTNILSVINDAFNEIDVSVTYKTGGKQGVYFTMPDETEIFLFSSTLNPMNLLTKFRQETLYAKQAYQFMTLQNIEMQDLNELKLKCSTTTWATVDSNTNTITIHGTGSTYALNTLYSTGTTSPIANSDTVIIESGITNMLSSSGNLATETRTENSFAIRNFVFEHSNSDTITLDTTWFPAPKSASNPKPVFNIYTDNDTVKNFSYSSNITVNFYSLSEWEG